MVALLGQFWRGLVLVLLARDDGVNHVPSYAAASLLYQGAAEDALTCVLSGIYFSVGRDDSRWGVTREHDHGSAKMKCKSFKSARCT